MCLSPCLMRHDSESLFTDMSPEWKISKKLEQTLRYTIFLLPGRSCFYCHVRKLGLREQPKTMGSQFSFFFSPYLTDFQHKITVQASPNLDKRRSLNSSSFSTPSSPTVIPRLRAIQRELSPPRGASGRFSVTN